ncbi:MAG: hypothetical protein CBR30_05735 [Dictyoglomus sp. NZ13-RE01]|nr:MAG: hypothetical protein CBR30_05735 [Dictyoglomus sp. NZ13-RE01]
MKIILIFMLLIFLINILWAQEVPVIENRSKVIARVRGVILGEFPHVELILEILKSENVEGYKNFAKENQIILATPFSQTQDLFLCYFLRPSDEVLCLLEFVGDERKRGWIIRSIKRLGREEDLEDVIKYFLIGKGFIKEGEDFSFEIVKKDENGWEVEVNLSRLRIRIVLDSSLSILSFSLL